MRLLLLEDDDLTRSLLDDALTAAGHEVDGCAAGEEAVAMAKRTAYAVLVLDRMVPGIDGLSALKVLREAGVQTPALLLTAMNGIADRVEGLEAGADDYLVKPFATSELIARVGALSRRPPLAENETVLRVADLEFNRIRRVATRAGRRIDLQPQEMKLLEYLMLHSGEVLTRAMLLEHVWGFHFDPNTNIIEAHISRLRAKIDRAFDRDLIHTVRGVGYRIA